MTFGTGTFALGDHWAVSNRGSEREWFPTVAWQHSGERALYALDGGDYSSAAAVDWTISLGLAREVLLTLIFPGTLGSRAGTGLRAGVSGTCRAPLGSDRNWGCGSDCARTLQLPICGAPFLKALLFVPRS